MTGYDDLLFARLLLMERTVSPQQLWGVLASWAPGLQRGDAPPLADLLTRHRLAEPQTLSHAVERLALFQRVEEERTLARALYHMNLVPRDEVSAAYEAIRKNNFQRRLGQHLLETRKLTRPDLETAQARTLKALERARARASDLMVQRVQRLRGDFNEDATQRLLEAFPLADVLPDDIAPPPPPPPPPSDAQDAPTRADSGRRTERLPAPSEVDPARTAPLHTDAPTAKAPEIDPESCPIYGYEIERELGKGSMGVVYKARNVFDGRVAALKILPLQLASQIQYLERFKREAMAIMRLEHPNLVQAYDFGGSEDYYYLALEYVEGDPLDQIIERQGRLPERLALDITRQVARGLGCAAQHGVLHRDVKPENILMTSGGIAKLCDFGIVKIDDLEEGNLTMAGTTVGTPFYISPEQARGEDQLDIRSDLYSLGISLFHLVTGQVPFTGKSQGAILVRHILEDVPDPRTLCPDLSPDLARVVARLTRKRREDRYPTPDDAAAEIDAILGTTSPLN